MKPQPFLIYSSLALGPSQKLSSPLSLSQGLGEGSLLKVRCHSEGFPYVQLGQMDGGMEKRKKSHRITREARYPLQVHVKGLFSGYHGTSKERSATRPKCWGQAGFPVDV